jgi:hypothetical protein
VTFALEVNFRFIRMAIWSWLTRRPLMLYMPVEEDDDTQPGAHVVH